MCVRLQAQSSALRNKQANTRRARNHHHMATSFFCFWGHRCRAPGHDLKHSWELGPAKSFPSWMTWQNILEVTVTSCRMDQRDWKCSSHKVPSGPRCTEKVQTIPPRVLIATNQLPASHYPESYIPPSWSLPSAFLFVTWQNPVPVLAPMHFGMWAWYQPFHRKAKTTQGNMWLLSWNASI